MDTTYLVGRLVGAAAMGTSRPVTTLFAVQLLVAWLVRTQSYELPPEIAWTVSLFALGIGLTATIVEWVVHHTEGADEMIRAMHADRVVAALMTIPSAMLLLLLTGVGVAAMEGAVEQLVAEGVAREQAISWVEQAAERATQELDERVAIPTAAAPTAEEQDILRATELLAHSDRSPAQQGLLFVIALTLNVFLTWIRGEVKELADSMSLERTWTWIESGGVLVGLVLLLVWPPLLFALSLAFALAMFGAYLALRGTAAALDAARRRPCPKCETSIREEASVCYKCGAEVELVRLLDGAEAELVGAPQGA